MLWTLARRDDAAGEVLATQSARGKTTLPVFSFREEADLFRLGLSGEGWRASSTRATELTALLLGSYRHVDRVALDPLPEGLGAEALNRLASLERTEFTAKLLGGTPPNTSA